MNTPKAILTCLVAIATAMAFVAIQEAAAPAQQPQSTTNILWGWRLYDKNLNKPGAPSPYQLGLRQDGVVVWRTNSNRP